MDIMELWGWLSVQIIALLCLLLAVYHRRQLKLQSQFEQYKLKMHGLNKDLLHKHSQLVQQADKTRRALLQARERKPELPPGYVMVEESRLQVLQQAVAQLDHEDELHKLRLLVKEQQQLIHNLKDQLAQAHDATAKQRYLDEQNNALQNQQRMLKEAENCITQLEMELNQAKTLVARFAQDSKRMVAEIELLQHRQQELEDELALMSRMAEVNVASTDSQPFTDLYAESNDQRHQADAGGRHAKGLEKPA